MKPIPQLLNGFNSFNKTEQLEHIFDHALSDGILSDIELKMIEEFYQESGLPLEEFTKARNQVFIRVLRKYTADKMITTREFASAYHIALQLEFSDEELEELNGFLNSFRAGR